MFNKIIKICSESIALNVVFQLLFVVFIVVNYIKADMNMLIVWSILCGCHIIDTIMVIARKRNYIIIKFDRSDRDDKD